MNFTFFQLTLSEALLCVVILCLFPISVAAETLERDAALSSLDLNETPVGTALQVLADKAKIKLLMDKPVGNSPISIHLSAVSPREALEALLQKANLRYDFVSDDMVVVTDAPPAHLAEVAGTKPDKLLRREVLVGAVSHRESLLPLPEGMRVGATFDASVLKAQTPNNNWYRIPDWYAGSWHTETNTTFHTQSYKMNSWSRYLSSLGLREDEASDRWQLRTFTARGDETCGFQRDKRGQIWEYEYANYLALTELDDYFSVHFVKELEVLENTSTKMVIKFVGTEVVVSKENRRIGASTQRESIQTYTPAGGNMRRCLYSVKTFDEDGKPESLSNGVSVELRTHGFVPWNSYKGQNMQRLFHEYLESHGLTEIIPIGKFPIKTGLNKYPKRK